jgi:hypothetical protein
MIQTGPPPTSLADTTESTGSPTVRAPPGRKSADCNVRIVASRGGWMLVVATIPKVGRHLTQGVTQRAHAGVRAHLRSAIRPSRLGFGPQAHDDAGSRTMLPKAPNEIANVCR